jgi:hypothetical protein
VSEVNIVSNKHGVGLPGAAQSDQKKSKTKTAQILICILEALAPSAAKSNKHC